MGGHIQPDGKVSVQIRENLVTWILIYSVLVGVTEALLLWLLETDPSRAGSALYIMVLAPVVAVWHAWYRFRRESRFVRLSGGIEDTLVDAGVVKGSPVLFFRNGLWAEQLVVPVDPSDPSTQFGKRITENRQSNVTVLVFRSAYDADRQRIPVSRANYREASIPRQGSMVVGQATDPKDSGPRRIPSEERGLNAALAELNLFMGVPTGTLRMKEREVHKDPPTSRVQWVCEYQVPFDDRFLHPESIERELIDISNVLDQACKVWSQPDTSPPPDDNDFVVDAGS